MKLIVFLFVAFVVIQTIAAKPIEIESEEAMGEVDPTKLHRAIKNVAKIQKALKAVEDEYRAQQWEETPQKSIHRKSLGSDFATVGKGVGNVIDFFGKFF
uniref:Uncharacterized protein n=1 Tax=Panagrolaimus sp. PS1159 TaxID=55785 RepID=A0AC35FZU6_9BILA